ncbi:zinc finger FYVE domain-containing protein 26 homolog [Anastrepha ludens]|uniref:zinc finger FYVE domain-containing protein 26 homolog n=1 Tax=Anastrepha ludens TaxID=28586 RepID=UPI0023AE8752|nr:zinc finger FYVE domain-containing protein 26 homolog [Anastrepha ludens]
MSEIMEHIHSRESNMQEYLELLPPSECSLLKSWLQALGPDIDSSGPANFESITQQLKRRTYPTLQILNLNREKSKLHIRRVIAEVLQLLLTQNDSKCRAQFINFIVNFPLNILDVTSLRLRLIKQLISEMAQTDDAYLALLARQESNLLVEVLEQSQEQWQNCTTGVPNKEFVLHQALRYKQHFAPLVAIHLKNAHSVADKGLRNNLLILKIANELSNTTQTLAEVGNINKWLTEYSVDDTPAHLKEMHKFFYADFQRIAIIIDFLKRFSEAYKCIPLDTILNTRYALNLLYDYDIDVSFEDTRRLLEATRKWQIHLSKTKCLYELEMETLNYYTALSTVCDIMLPITINCNSDTYYDGKIQQLNAMLRKILNVDMLCALIEDIFQLIFLRWEHLRMSSNIFFSAIRPNRSHSGHSSAANSTAAATDETHTTSMRSTPTSASSGRHGFICNGRSLQAIFGFLKNFITKKIHSEDYKHASERVQLRFQRIIDVISEALWKYSVLEKFDNSPILANIQQKYGLAPEDLLQLVRVHADAVDKSSSDDDSRDRSNHASLSRRKAARKKRRATISGAAGVVRPMLQESELNQGSGNLMARSVTAAEDGAQNPVHELKSRREFDSFTERSIIPQMLGSPEDLAIVALSLNNFNDVKFIIETFHLQNTALNRELLFVEQQQQIKHKLATIYEKYEQKEQCSGVADPPKATVEQIRNVADKGFSISRIISVIDKFALTQSIQATPEQQQICQRHMNNPQYSFLRNFETHNLNAIIITDLVLNLPFNREIISNVLTVIRRQQQVPSGSMSRSFRTEATATATAGNTSNTNSQLYGDMGALTLLENLSECLASLKQQRLSQLLYDNHYSLKPHKLAVELQRERAFHSVFLKAASEIGHIDDLRTHGSLFHDLQAKCNYYQRFIAYVQQLAYLVHLRDRNIEYHTSALLKINICDVIGELIFECDMTPLEIEANVSALNLNLVHVIALNVCPEIAGKCGGVGGWKGVWRKISDQKAENILNYVANQNSLLARLLQGVINAADVSLSANNLSTQYLESLLELEEIECLAQLFDGNKFVAALRSDYDPRDLVANVTSKLTQLELLTLELGYQPKALQQARTDQLLVQVIEEDARNICLAGRIHDVGVRAKLIRDNFTKIATTRLAKELIENTLQHKHAATSISVALRHQLEETLADITIYAKVSEVLQFETWPRAYDFGLKTPTAIFEKLLQLHLYKLCYNWCRVVKLTAHFAAQKQRFLDVLLYALLEFHDDIGDSSTSAVGVGDGESEVNKYLLQILETFPVADVVEFLDKHKDKFRSVYLMSYAVDYLSRHNPHECQSYRNYKISLVIFEQLTPNELAPFWKLFKYPLLIIEQLVMNTKFETLTKVLAAVRSALSHVDAVDAQVCSFCFDKRGHIYDIHTRSPNSPLKVKFQLGTDTGHTTNSAFILLNFNLYQKNHVITHECIDLLLRIYGTKALDYHVSDIASSSERISQTTDMQQSLDSLCGAFQMPPTAPTRDDWVRDDDATHCMCCHRAAFTMLMRRHHCRRCGRVVCFACSTHRMRIPALYDDVEVRVCNDCFSKTEEAQRKRAEAEVKRDGATTAVGNGARVREIDAYKWQLCGNITHDKLLREEFCYEHAPSVALCLSILAFHQGQQKCVDLLLYHCHKLEKLFVPNPEVDYELVAKMMSCLALAAKVRGGPPEIETIREHAAIIMSVVQNGCEALIPAGPLNNHSLRKLGDSLVQAEKWDLAFEVHLKCGFPTAGVMAAHGLSCLRAGCFDTAREKFSHCMTKLSSEYINAKICKYIMSTSTDADNNESPFEWYNDVDIQAIKRPQRGPPLLQEIVKTIENTPCLKPQPETLKRASLIRSSNTSLASLLSRRKDPCPIRLHEPALGILNTLANLKKITKGQYTEVHSNFSGLHTNLDNKSRQYLQHTRGFEECLHYVLTYGSHTDVLQFLMRHHELIATLKYYIEQNLETELFIQNIFLISLRNGAVPTLIEHMQKLDASLSIWRVTLLQTCHYLETQNLLNSLYQLQLLLQDPVRASMTCVRFYSKNCDSFQKLHANAMHLHNAHKHLQSQLEVTQWDKVDLEPMLRKRNSSVGSRRSSRGSGAHTPALHSSFLMEMDARALNSHINTILMQLEVAKFLAHCEKESNPAEEPITLKTLKQIRLDHSLKLKLPTLFDGLQERIEISILILLCGKNIDEGFGLTYRIINHYKLPGMKVFAAAAKFLACNQRIGEVEKLISCITSNNGIQTRDIDEILSVAINSACNSNAPEVKAALDNLAKKIHSVELRISCHIFIGQLKSAYLLANKYERIGDIRRILRQAELTNQVHIKKLCERKLNFNAAARE